MKQNEMKTHVCPTCSSVVKIKRTRAAPSYLAGRNAIISRIARERGIGIIAASRAVREEGLWQRPPEPAAKAVEDDEN